MSEKKNSASAAVMAQQEEPAAQTAARSAGGRYRWTICALLFFATTINYVDRAVLGILAPTLQKTIGWNEVQYGYIVMAFMTSYALGIVFVGRFIDRVGTRKGYVASIGL